MKRLILPRRRALVLSGGALVAPMIASGIARAADDWPNKPVRYINVFPPGGPTDTLSRIVCNQPRSWRAPDFRESAHGAPDRCAYIPQRKRRLKVTLSISRSSSTL
jgi:hypothetical protein